MSEDLRQLVHLCDLFEHRVERIDTLSKDDDSYFAVPSGAEIRHALKEGIAAYLVSDRQELSKAIRKAEAAVQDTHSFEASLLLERFGFFQQKWREVSICDAAPSYESKCIFFGALQQSIDGSKNKRMPLTPETIKNLEIAHNYLAELALIEPELGKKLKSIRTDRRDKRKGELIFLAIGMVTLIAIIIFGTWENVKPWFHHESKSILPVDASSSPNKQIPDHK